MTPAISICIPTYNRADSLGNLVRRFLADKFEDFELIIANDCSTDHTDDVMTEFSVEDSDKRIKYFKHQTNIGIKANWDFVVRKATAPLIFRIDDDDYVSREFLTKMVGLFDRYKSIGSAYSGFSYDSNGSTTEIIDRATFGSDVITSKRFCRNFLLHNPFPAVHFASVVFRREVAEKVDFFTPPYCDQLFALALATQAPVGYIPEPLFYYVQHDEARHSNAHGVHADPLNLYKKVYHAGIPCFNLDPYIQSIKEQVHKRHSIIYPCTDLYTTRANFKSRRLVIKTALDRMRQIPSLRFNPLFWATLLSMLGPDWLVTWLRNIYRRRKA